MLRDMYELYKQEDGKLINDSDNVVEQLLLFCVSRETYLNCVDGSRDKFKEALQTITQDKTLQTKLYSIKHHFEAEFFDGLSKESFCYQMTAQDFLLYVLHILKLKQYRFGKKVQFRFFNY